MLGSAATGGERNCWAVAGEDGDCGSVPAAVVFLRCCCGARWREKTDRSESMGDAADGEDQEED